MAGLIDRANLWFARLSRLPRDAVRRVAGGHWFSVGVASGSGLPPLNDQTAMTISAVTACVKLLSGVVSALPMNIYEMNLRTGARSQRWGDDLWWILNEQWHQRWPAAAGWEALMRSRLLHGDAYAVIERNRAGAVLALRPVKKHRVTTYLLESDRLVYAVSPEPGAFSQEIEYYDQDDMLHVPGDGFDGLSSPSPLQFELGIVGPTALSATQQAARFFANGMMPGFTISKDGDLTPEQLTRLREDVERMYGGVQNFHRPMLLTGGLKASPLSISPADAQLLESRKFGVEEIARVYGVPPFMIGHTEKSTSFGTGLEAIGSNFTRLNLRPHLNAITNEFNRKLFRRGGQFCEFDTSELERPSFREFLEALRIGVGRAGERPIFTQNEARARFNLPPVDGGDDASPLVAKAGAPAVEERTAQ